MRVSSLLPALAISFAVLGAAPAGTHADSGFALRAQPDGLTFIGDTVRAKLPTELPLPAYDSDLVTVSNGRVDLDVHAVELIPHDEMLEVYVSLDLHASAFLDAGFTDCDLDVYARPLDLGAELRLRTTADGIVADAVMLDVGLTADQFNLDFHGCVLGDLLEAVLEAVEGWALDKATTLLEELAAEKILPMLQDAINEFTTLELDVAGFQINADIDGLDLDPATGLTVTADGAILWTGPVRGDLASIGAPATEPAIGEALPGSYGPADFAIAASDDRVTEALYQAWRGGMFHDLLSNLAPSLELDGEGLAQKLGLPAGTRVDVAIDLQVPPAVTFGRGPDATGVRINLTNVAVTATVDAPGSEPSDIEITLDGTLHARVGIAPGAGALEIEATELSITRVSVDAGSQFLDIDPARLRAFLEAAVVPLVGGALENIPVAPALNPMDDLFAVARDITTQGGWLRVAVDMYRPDPNDAADPTTELVRPATVVAPALARFPVTGTDDTTPPELLRYIVVLDGEPQSEEPAFLSQVSVSAAEGNHILEVRAVDLSGREDRTPAVHSFYIDGTPPELTVTTAPDSIIRDGGIFANWMASDDHTEIGAVETRWELRKVTADESRGVVVASDDFTAGRLSMQLDHLEENGLYVLEVTARDEAGNVTSSEHGFAVEPGGAGGCSAGGTGAAPLIIIFAAAALLIFRRRHRGAAAAAILTTVALTGTAAAQGVGTNLSGPTDGDGAAAFWNPAAMTRARESRADIGSGLSLIRATYTPMDRTDSSQTFVPKPEPTVGAVIGLEDSRWRAGFTIGVPSIDGASWSRDDAASDITRWYAVEARTFHVTVTPAVAYAPAPWISIGGGIDIVRSQIRAQVDKDMGKQLNLAAGSPVYDSPFPYGDPAMAAPTLLEGTGWGVGAVGGVMVRPHHRVTIGASIHAPVTTKAHGSVDVQYPEAMRSFVEEAAPAAELPELAGSTEIPLTMPMMTFAAVAVEPIDGWELRADYRFTDRSAASDLNVGIVEATSPDVKDTLVVRGYRDRHSAGLRSSHLLWSGRALASLRARVEPNSVPEQTAAPNNIDFDKLELGVAGAVALSRNVTLILQYSHYFMPARTVDDSLHQPLAESTLDAYNHPAPTGEYSAVSDYLAFALSVSM